MAVTGDFVIWQPSSSGSPWWLTPTPTCTPDTRPNASLDTLRARHQLLKTLRLFFDQRGFLEVTTPVLSQDTVIDEHLDPFHVTCYSDPQNWQTGPTRYLQTSPEFHMKRILAAGAESDLPAGTGVSCGRAGSAAQSRIHDARMVSGRR